jgi:hypothetical protein
MVSGSKPLDDSTVKQYTRYLQNRGESEDARHPGQDVFWLSHWIALKSY